MDPTGRLNQGLSRSDEHDLTVILARHAVEEVAPEELPLFHPTTEAWLDRRAAATRDTDEMLGFGVDAATAEALFVTPVALEVAKAASGYAIAVIKSAWKEQAKPRIRSFTRRLLGPEAVAEADAAADEPVVFTAEQLAEIREQAIQTARRAGIKGDRASLLADAIVGAIAR